MARLIWPSPMTPRPNYLYINQGNGKFKDESYRFGFAVNADGREIAGMGMAIGDYQNNGLLDLFVSELLPTTIKFSITMMVMPALVM